MNFTESIIPSAKVGRDLTGDAGGFRPHPDVAVAGDEGVNVPINVSINVPANVPAKGKT